VCRFALLRKDTRHKFANSNLIQPLADPRRTQPSAHNHGDLYSAGVQLPDS
jgi:hypothetical protein